MYAVRSSVVFSILTFFFFYKKHSGIVKVSNNFDHDQSRRFVGLYLGLKCLPKLSEDTSR